MPQPQPEQLDCAAVLEEFANRSANLGNEIAFMHEEIESKDKQLDQINKLIAQRDGAIQRWIKNSGSHEPYPKEELYRTQIRNYYEQADKIAAEKVTLAEKTRILMDKKILWLDEQIKLLQTRGEFPNDPELPSLLNPQPQKQAVRAEPSVSSTPLSQVPNPAATPHQRHPNQHPLRVMPPQVQTHNLPGATGPSSAPVTPAAALLLNQQRRDSSLGPGPKRQRTMGSAVTPSASSSLARHPSMTPGTPRSSTPTAGVRQSSIGPRASQKTTMGNKKVAPQGSRQSGAPRKKMPKSGLSRVKRTGNKNSPSSTNDSELSDADSGSVDDEDDPHTPARGDEDMPDAEDEEGGDDRKYCTCQSVSYGDMVACDNENCPYEWFHWSCVGLKSEPVGTWICPVCTKAQKK
jgi:inhibitor of growth protein 3